MKKILSILTASILAGSLMVGCSNDTSDTSKDSNTKVEVEKPKEKTNKVNVDNMIVEQESMTFKLDGVKVVKDYDDNDALEINYTFTNKQEDATSALVGVCIDGYQNGKEMEIAIVNSSEFNEQTDLKKGITQDNCKSYHLLRDDSPIELEIYETYGSAWDKNPAVFKINIQDGSVTRTK
ncbi:MAG: DUF5067 domain-containing protein [Terrisporobacter sp.]|uniref:DUF5067 domain-containing protein n=1 Tax=Terrisporobacter sp. TaxID=1965305 RepID=UPI002FC90477